MVDLDFAALKATPVADRPFPHVIVRNFVPRELLEEIVPQLPSLGTRGGSFPIDAFALGPIVKDFFATMKGDQFRRSIAEKFALDLHGAPVMITLRGYSRERDGQIHRDSATKRVTVLVYLNTGTNEWEQHAGCLRLLRGPEDLEDYMVEVPPVNGTLLVFPNGPATWHGHKTFIGPRYVVQLNYMTTDSVARSELRRHRLSAFVKRLVPAA